LLGGDFPVPADRHPFAGAVAVSVIDEIRSTSARQHEDAKSLELAAPERELLFTRQRRLDSSFCQLRHSSPTKKLTKNSQRNRKPWRAASQDKVAL
jgi:hypothetical protein